MRSGKNVMIIGSVIVIFVILQAILILTSGKVNNPAEVAIEFTKRHISCWTGLRCQKTSAVKFLRMQGPIL